MKRRLGVKTLLVGFVVFSAFGLWGCQTTSQWKPGWQNEFETLFDPITDEQTHKYFKHSKAYDFRPEAKELNKANLAWLADAAMLAYCDTQFVKDELAKVKFNNDFAPVNNEGTQGFIAGHEEAIFVIFRGTQIQEPEDLLADVKFLPAPERHGKVHRGFKEALDVVWGDVSERLHVMTKSGDRSVWFTGHSLGAAIAIIAAGRWKADHVDQDVSLYTFGAPGVGDRDYVNGYPKMTVVRVIDNEDQVAKVSIKDRLEHPKGVEVRYVRPPWVIEKRHEQLPDLLADHAPIYYAESSWKKVTE